MLRSTFDKCLKNAQEKNHGWIHAGDIPRAKVFCDGEELKRAVSVNLSEGVVICHKYPYVIDRQLDETEKYEVRGAITLEPMNEN